jgi:hypothetical protein
MEMTSATMTAHEDLYRARAGEPTLVEVPPARFLMIDGTGKPGGKAFEQAVGALYAIAYTSKFALKKAGGPDVKVPPLEGLYDVLPVPGPAHEPAMGEGQGWTLMIRLPEPIDEELVERSRAEALRRKGLPAIRDVRLRVFDEGTAVQILHVGPYAEETAAIEALREFIADRGRAARGRHHEIYLSVPGRTRSERLRTILRQPLI